MNNLKYVRLFISLSILIVYFNSHASAQLSNEQIKAFRSAKTIRIVVNAEYNKEGLNLPLFDESRKIFLCTGFEIVEADAEDYDITLIIKSKGKALGAWYNDGQYHYTGASLSGLISLEMPSGLTYSKSFDADQSISGNVWSDATTTINSGCLKQLFEEEGSFYTKILQIITDVYGQNTLISILKCNKSYMLSYRLMPQLVNAGKPIVPHLITLLPVVKHNESKMAIISALGYIKDPLAVEHLIHMVKNHERLAYVAIQALGEIGDKRATKVLESALNDELNAESRSMLHYIVEALGKINDPRSIQLLIFLLNDESSLTRYQTTEVLRKMTGKDFGEEPSKWQKWWEQNKE